MAKITVWPLFHHQSLSAGDSATSGKIDLRYCANQRQFSLAINTCAGTNGTAGTTIFSYIASSTEEGSYTAPGGSVAIGTAGTTGTNNIIDFSPVLTPFMKIISAQTGTGTSGSDTKFDAELIVQ
jgi:hypothetical protein